MVGVGCCSRLDSVVGIKDEEARGCVEREMNLNVSVGLPFLGVFLAGLEAMSCERQTGTGGLRTVEGGGAARGKVGAVEVDGMDGGRLVGDERTMATSSGSKKGSARYRCESKLCRLVGERRGVLAGEDCATRTGGGGGRDGVG